MQSGIKTGLNIASREFFQVSLVTYLLLTLAETLKEGFVSNFFNMNYLLLVVLATGLAMVLTEPAESEIGQAVEAVRENVIRAHQAVRRGRAQVLDLRGQRPHTPIRPTAAKPVTRPRQMG